jgi:hypothetical protein
MITITPGVAGFIKGLLTVLVLAGVSYLAQAQHLSGLLGPTVSIVAASLFSSLESSLKAKSGGEKGLFGAVRVRSAQR